MKMSKSILTGSLTLSMLFALACGKPDASRLEGQWQISKQEIEVESDLGQSKSSQKVPQAQAYIYSFQSGRMSVLQPGTAGTTFQSSGAAAGGFQAAYQVEGRDLIVSPTSGQQTKFEILDLDEDEMKLRLEKNSNARKETHTLEFTRIGKFSPSQPGQSGAPIGTGSVPVN